MLTDSFNNAQIHFAYPQIECCGKHIVFAQGNYKKKPRPSKSEPVDYLVITKRYYNSLCLLSDFYRADTIVLPQEIYPTKLMEFHQEAESCSIANYDMKQKGALIHNE